VPEVGEKARPADAAHQRPEPPLPGRDLVGLGVRLGHLGSGDVGELEAADARPRSGGPERGDEFPVTRPWWAGIVRNVCRHVT